MNPGARTPTRVARIALVGLALAAGAARAQVTTDGSLGGAVGPVPGGALADGSVVTYRIDEGLGRRSGANLFHSFGSFVILPAETAAFTADAPTLRILARVTGGAAADINGRLISTVPGASLFLFSPAGIRFGPFARLDLPGSLHFSSADTLRFADGTSWSAAAGDAPGVLSSAAPSAWGFLGGGAGAIDVAAPLAAASGFDLDLVGGDLRVVGPSRPTSVPRLATTDGALRLVSVAPGARLDVPIDAEAFRASAWDPELGGRISIADLAIVSAASDARAGAGKLAVRAGEIEVSDVAQVFTTADGAAGGDLDVRAGEVRIDGGVLGTNLIGAAPGGDVVIATDSLAVLRGGSVLATSNGAGAGGDVRIQSDLIRIESGGTLVVGARREGAAGQLFAAADALEIEGSASGILAESRAAGDGGQVWIEAGRLVLRDGAQVRSTAEGAGRGADLRVVVGALEAAGNGTGLVASTRSLATDAGDGGAIRVVADTVALAAGAQLSAGTEGAGAGGGVSLEASGDVTLEGVGADGPAGVVSQSGRAGGSAATGAGGRIRIAARSLTLRDGAVVSSRAFGEGRAGDVDVDLRGTLALTGGAAGASAIAASGAGGDGGRIEIDAARVDLVDGGLITSSAVAAGDAGGVVVRAGDLRIAGRDPALGNPSGLFAAASNNAAGAAGTIEVDVANALRVERDGRISARLNVGSSGDSGGLDVRAGSVALASGGRLETATDGSGDAGAISVRAGGDLSLASGARISSASSGPGRAGDVELRAGGNLRIEDGAEISARSSGTGDAGSVRVAAGRAIEVDDASIEISRKLFGGDIELTAPRKISLIDAELITRVVEDAAIDPDLARGEGGNIRIDPDVLLVLRSEINANGTGAGGNLDLIAKQLIVSADSVLTADSRLGIDGRIRLEGDDQVVRSVARLPAVPEDRGLAIAERCALREGRAEGSLVLSGPRGVPDTPLRRLRPWWPASPADDVAGTERARAAEARSDWVEAAEVWRAGLAAAAEAGAALDPAAEAALRVRAAQVLLRAGDPDAALEVLAPVSSPAASALRARVRARDGDLEAAQSLLRGARAAAQGVDALRLDLEAVLLEPVRSPDPARALAERASELGRPDLAALAWAASARAGPDAAALRERALDSVERARDLPRPDARRLKLQIARAERADRPLRAAQLLGDVLVEAERAGDARSATWAAGWLADLHADRGAEATALELWRRALAHAEHARAPEARYRWSFALGRAFADRGETARALPLFELAAADLRDLRARALRGAARHRRFARDFPLEPVADAWIAALLERAGTQEDPALREALLERALAALEELRRVAVADWFEDECAALQQRRAADEVPGTLVVHPVLLEQRTELLVRAPGEPLRSVVVAAGRDEVEARVRELRRTLPRRTHRRFRKPAAQLYEWLIRPLAAELARPDVESLVVVPSGTLLGVPLAALWDARAEQFLIEQVPLAIAPGLTLVEPRPMPADPDPLLVGVSEARPGFAALPHVARELSAVRERVGGEVLIDAAFSRERLAAALAARPRELLHVASHAEFGASLEQSFVLAWDGRLGVEALTRLVARTRYRDRPLELLTLSACQTAAGDARSALGLAGVALQAGARTTLATLWSVDDRAATALMSAFYTELSRPGTSRAAALARAQRALLADPALRHPASWSPFVLIGNWR